MKCAKCGKDEIGMTIDSLCEKCWLEKFWLAVLDEDAIVIDGVCYHDRGAQPETTAWLGFGGRKFKIEMNDGRIIETNNLWHNGTIPENLKVPDNAKFI